MSALAAARQAVAAALGPSLNALGAAVHDQPPGSLQPPCVVLMPGQPWIKPRGHVTLNVVAYANPAGGNSTALTNLEDLVEAVRTGLATHGLGLADTDPPDADPDNGVLSASTPVTVRVNCY